MKILRRQEVSERVGLKTTALYEMINRGEFPRPMKLSERAVGWLESDIDEWIQSRIKHRDLTALEESDQNLWTTVNAALDSSQRKQANQLLFELHSIRRAFAAYTNASSGIECQLAQRLKKLTDKFPNHLED